MTFPEYFDDPTDLEPEIFGTLSLIRPLPSSIPIFPSYHNAPTNIATEIVEHPPSIFTFTAGYYYLKIHQQK